MQKKASLVNHVVAKDFEMVTTLESVINIALRLLIFGIFSRGYGLITDLKDINFTT